MAAPTTHTNLNIPTGRLPGETTTRSIRIPAPIRIDNSACSDSISPFSTSPDLSLPPANPQFVFPGRQGPSSAPSSYSRATGRRTRSAFEPADRLPEIFRQGFNPSPRPSPGLPDFSFNPGATLAPDNSNRQTRSPAPSLTLPDFSFNPGATPDDSSLLSPPKTPQSPRMPPNRHGHRRGASEFVGGKLRAGDAITVMGVSPTKSESGFASPLLKPTEQPARRRGHQHRRSAAISQHDLTMIMKPSNDNSSRGSSAPTSPASLKPSPLLPSLPALEPPALQIPNDEPSTPLESMPVEPELPQEAAEPEAVTPPKVAPRARVGFSDTLEFIPRPLSLVSTDTTSTFATIRPGGHSASNSISSIISLGSGMMTDREPSNMNNSASSSFRVTSRPSTAGAVLENTPLVSAIPAESLSPRRRNSIPLLTGLVQDDAVEPAATTPIKTPKRWSFFGLDPFTGSNVPSKGRPQTPNPNDSGIAARAAEAELDHAVALSNSVADHDVDVKKSSSKKKKQKKVRAWGTSILTRKGKSRSAKAIPGRRRSLTPPPTRAMFNDEAYEDDLDDLPPFAPLAARGFPTSAHKITRPRSSSDDEASHQMIDLDAALGPFNTPTYSAEWEAAQRTGQPTRRPLHSAAGMRGFAGPGMHYHRRAESAPTLPPFEGRFGMNRFGSSSTMADVFEEDEEDDLSDTTSSTTSITISSEFRDKGDDSTASEHDSTNTPTQERDLGILLPVENASVSSSVKRKGSGSSLDLQPPGFRMRTEIPGGSLHDFVIIEEESAPSLRPLSAASSVAPSSSRRTLPNRDLAPVDVNSVSLAPPPLTSGSIYSINHSSSFPSPRSPMSDAHRISTAPSSIADENSFQSLLMGEPGPEIVRISIDVPSLTSSNSTMTRDSNFLPPVRPRGKPFQEQRPASFTSAFGRRRSSLASLSRLISSAHGERSKLSEEVAVEDEPEQKQKASRAKRISRMMQFWKSKQPAES
ncbi:hypothetical protein MN608_05000 [Microdochium nivale]|nr:hypothetical protein MN608_05000 [Microdochium nivale]